MLSGVDIRNEDDWWDAVELRPGEFSVSYINHRAGELGVSREFGGRVVDSGPMASFRRRGGGTEFQCGDIVTRIRG